MAGNEDRRVRRTRHSLQQALVALITERGYEKVTVQEVLDRADVGRTTFYAHFRDKDALFASCFDDLRADLERELNAMDGAPPRDPASPIGVIFEHADRNRPVYRAVGAAHLHDLLFRALRDHLAEQDTRLPVEIVAEYHASALIGVLGWWVRAGFPSGPKEMARMCREMTQPGVMAALRAIHPEGPR
ncbi:TetR/AcrR family transcriptional regulator [Actinoplanes sp. KI2]|uniref:TetR/AcrR family transcriptional regulator n=1 Tax=Actinoplanes sp. KI2 TaxID=2983315 RepID=UPI0021D5E6C9|nr:TetR/AcrR family transcriptional regulator [Actinoplanes sp. KI2]MCU7723128.1 TetR/AcrR family transcriptional regulator [Actinoplanes sp. KI2]